VYVPGRLHKHVSLPVGRQRIFVCQDSDIKLMQLCPECCVMVSELTT
jgi:hypothetical protein